MLLLVFCSAAIVQSTQQGLVRCEFATGLTHRRNRHIHASVTALFKKLLDSIQPLLKLQISRPYHYNTASYFGILM
ncbi:hypothetical protein SODALDRAFT_67724 [Sodiomyces alkalinus F11]|uniref:Secreted protein n=1 Tax=Sodiomyces alkalinus (strain CBS 110278 / VKM F-3762 / F11) TaxID=1314773 RepID=A0A3N2PM46_SODAK|nr:hypothetical protein SODALDRAFT_67724 [Sodiomyces alkalinus F11]ROT35484.1 hypothetical protein SODALDRAFT_67724 [Sodiomyces alkalinus F11]